jgi:hypothetical protein
LLQTLAFKTGFIIAIASFPAYSNQFQPIPATPLPL